VKERADEDGTTFTYGHLDPESVTVVVGDYRIGGSQIGSYADSTNGSSSSPHLHFEQMVCLLKSDPP
jgi:murein DD-endopeptidase MepM/ murein hydrolase activator NlpD